MRTISSSSLELCCDCAKQFVRNVQNCGKTNQPAHTSMLVCEFLAKNKTLILLQPPYSVDLVPANFFLFPKMKTPMRGNHFATVEEIKEKRNRNCSWYPKARFWGILRIGNTLRFTSPWLTLLRFTLSNFLFPLISICVLFWNQLQRKSKDSVYLRGVTLKEINKYLMKQYEITVIFWLHLVFLC